MIEGIRFSELGDVQELKGTEMIPIVDGNENKKLKADKIATKKDISAFATKEDVDNKNKEQDAKLRTLENDSLKNTDLPTVNGIPMADIENIVIPESVGGGVSYADIWVCSEDGFYLVDAKGFVGAKMTATENTMGGINYKIV